MTSDQKAPRHIGYIVDGNRRWAKSHGLPNYEGHLAGYNAILDVVIATARSGVEYISAYFFSTENWQRPRPEVAKIMRLTNRVVKEDLHLFIENNMRIRWAGTAEGLSDALVADIKKAEEMTAHCTGATLIPCFNYGGHQEVLDAMKNIIKTGVQAEDLTIEDIAAQLYVPEIPPIDLIVRTSGEQRLSNFMLWRAAYSELIFLEKFWPDMREDDVRAIIEEYNQRERRLGK